MTRKVHVCHVEKNEIDYEKLQANERLCFLRGSELLFLFSHLQQKRAKSGDYCRQINQRMLVLLLMIIVLLALAKTICVRYFIEFGCWFRCSIVVVIICLGIWNFGQLKQIYRDYFSTFIICVCFATRSFQFKFIDRISLK